MSRKKSLAILMAALALSGTGSVVQMPQSHITVVAAIKRAKRARKHVKKHVKKRVSRKKRVKKHVVKRPRKPVKHKLGNIFTQNSHTSGWWSNLPAIQWDTTLPIEQQYAKALSLQGQERLAADYAIMKEQNMVTGAGVPLVSPQQLETQMQRNVNTAQSIVDFVTQN